MFKRPTTLLVSAAGVVLFMAGQLVVAQIEIEEIIVAAQKREQSLQDVPISISVFSADEIVHSGYDDFKSIILRSPGLAGWADGSILTSLSVRGISTNDFGIGGDPSIGLFRNGIYSGRAKEATSAFYDMERVEVIKGPQGLLFGRGAASGAISLYTAKADPSSRYGELNIGGGERGQLRGGGHINLPISDNSAIRIAGMHSEEDGFIKNSLGGPDLGSENRDAFRVSFGHQDGPWRVDIITDYEHRDRTATIYNQLDFVTGVPLSGAFDTIASDLGDDSRVETKVSNTSIEISYDFDSATLTSLTGLRFYETDYLEDFDGSAVTLVHYSQPDEGEFFSQELRLVSNQGGRWQWLAGVSGFYDEIDSEFFLQADDQAICSLFFGADCSTVLPGYAGVPGFYLESGAGKGEVYGAGVYGDLSYAFNEKLIASLGLRFSYDKREYSLVSDAIAGDIGAVFFGRLAFIYGFESTTPITTDDSWTDISPRFLLQYVVNDNLTLYGSVTKGFKPGGFDSFGVTTLTPGFPTAIPGPGAQVGSFDPETVWSFEAGLKGTAANGNLAYNISGYYYDYTDLQSQTLHGVVPVVENVGSASGGGIEMDINWLLHEYVNVRFGFAYADTEIDEIDITTCALANGDPCDGNRLAFNPEWTTFGSINGLFPITDKANFFATAEYNYSDSYFTDITNFDIKTVDSFTIVNLRAGIEYDDRYTLSVFLENATDEEFFGNIFVFDPLAEGAEPNHPRTFGIDFRWRFGN